MIDMLKQPKTYVYVMGFVLAFLTSLVVHLPASLVTQNEQVRAQLAASDLSITSVSGTIWRGSVNVAVQGNHTGEFAWHVNPTALLAMQTDVDLNWRYQGSDVFAHLNTGLLEQELIFIDEVKGVLVLGPLVGMIKSFNPKMPSMLSQLEGRVQLESLRMALNPKTQWPSDVKGNAKLVGVSFMNNALPITKVNVKQKTGKKSAKLPIDFNLVADANDWNLQGNGQLTHQQRYSGDISVKSVDEKSLPDWVFMMRQKSPTHFSAKFKGRF